MVSIISNKISIPHLSHNYNIFVTDLKLQSQCDTEICIFETHSQHTSPPYDTPHFPIFHTIHIYNLTNYFISLQRKSSSGGRMSQMNRKNNSISPLLSVDLLAYFSYLLKVKYSMMLYKKKCVQRNYQQKHLLQLSMPYTRFQSAPWNQNRTWVFSNTDLFPRKRIVL